MRPIAAALSKHFNRDVTSLAALFDPDDPPPIRELVASINRLKSSIATSELKSAEIPSSLAQEAAKVHALNRQVIKTSIRILEQTIHGSVARGSKAKAEYLAAVAGGMNTKLSLQHGQLMAQVYSPEMQDALRAKTEEIDQRSRTAKRQIREAEERLDGYSKIGGMDAIAREYAEIMRERQSVEAEIERLEKQS